MLGAAIRWSFTCCLRWLIVICFYPSLSWRVTDNACQPSLLQLHLRQIPWHGRPGSAVEAVDGKTAHGLDPTHVWKLCVRLRLTCVDRNGLLQQKNRLFPVGLGGLRTRGEHHLAHKKKNFEIKHTEGKKCF